MSSIGVDSDEEEVVNMNRAPPPMPSSPDGADNKKRGRGRPPKRPQQAISGMRQQALVLEGDDAAAVNEAPGQVSTPTTLQQPAPKKPRAAGPPPSRSSYLSDDDSGKSDSDDDSDNVLNEFRGGPLSTEVAVCMIPKPDFGDEHHMWFQTTQVAHMATLFKCLSKLLTSAHIIFAPEGWRLTATNSKKTALISLRVTEQTMAEGLYECNYNYRVCVPIDELAYRLRMRRRAEVMTMELRGKRPKDIRLVFSSGRRVTEMILHLRQPDTVHIRVPELTYHTQVDLPADEFREVVNSVKSDTLITDVTFTKHPRKFTVTVKTMHGPIHTHFLPENSPDSVRFLRAAGTAGELVEEAEGEEGGGTVYKSTLALAEIVGFSEVTRASKWVCINMPEEQVPLRMSYAIAALGDIAFYLAPKVDGEEDAPDQDANNQHNGDEDGGGGQDGDEDNDEYNNE